MKVRLHTVHPLLFLTDWASYDGGFNFFTYNLENHFSLFYFSLWKNGVNFPTIWFFFLNFHVFVMGNLDLLALISVSENNNVKVPHSSTSQAERYFEILWFRLAFRNTLKAEMIPPTLLLIYLFITKQRKHCCSLQGSDAPNGIVLLCDSEPQLTCRPNMVLFFFIELRGRTSHCLDL